MKVLTKEELKEIFANGTKPGAGGGSGNTNCGQEPDPITNPVAHQFWEDCVAGGKPTICPPGDEGTNP